MGTLYRYEGLLAITIVALSRCRGRGVFETLLSVPFSRGTNFCPSAVAGKPGTYQSHDSELDLNPHRPRRSVLFSLEANRQLRIRPHRSRTRRGIRTNTELPAPHDSGSARNLEAHVP